jgi:hypothetical protein
METGEMVLPYGAEGKKWEGTEEEAELRKWGWEGETDESLRMALAGLSRVRFLPSRHDDPALTSCLAERASHPILAARNSPFFPSRDENRLLLLRLASSLHCTRSISCSAYWCTEKLGRSGSVRGRELREVRLPLLFAS